MRAAKLTDLLKKGDRIAVSNITGREASKVTEISQRYGRNIVGGWALGKSGRQITVNKQSSIPVFADYQELIAETPKKKHPNKIIIYSPPEAVYGDVKNVISQKASAEIETIFVITENVAVEVAAKIQHLCQQQNIDVIGCNTLGIINPAAQVRIGAVGGDQPLETFHPGGATIISNSGNMVNTMATYLYGAGIGIRFGISTGKDQLILTPLKNLLQLAAKDRLTKIIILYVEPGGLYELAAIEWMKQIKFRKPLLVYVGGAIADQLNLSLGHPGAVVEGAGTSAGEKITLFDEYLGVEPHSPGSSFRHGKLPRKGLRVENLHDLPAAARALYGVLKIERDYRHYHPLHLNPWLKNMGKLAKRLPPKLVLAAGRPPAPYRNQFKQYYKTQFGKVPSRRNMRKASHASSNDGETPRIYGHNLIRQMAKHSFAYALINAWTGYPPSNKFEEHLVECTMTAALSNGPGTISAQAAKLSASAGNEPNTAMIATKAAIGTVHGGNGSQAAELLIKTFRDSELTDPYKAKFAQKTAKLAQQTAIDIARRKRVAKEADAEFQHVPCLGHPVYRDKEVNYDPRERIVAAYLEQQGIYHVFLEFYHQLAHALYKHRVTRRILAVNVDAAIACIWMGICWPLLNDKKITVERARHIPFLAFALGRAAGGAAEYLDHTDHGSPMDMRIPIDECEALSHPQDD